MKQKTIFNNFGNTGYRYRPMNGRYIGIHTGRSLLKCPTATPSFQIFLTPTL